MPWLEMAAHCVSALVINAKSGALLSEFYAKRAFAAHKVTKINIYIKHRNSHDGSESVYNNPLITRFPSFF